MRYKRVNTLAVDFGVLPRRPGALAIQKFIETKLRLDISKLKSVQLHSTRGTAYIGLPDELPADTVANEHHLKHQMDHDGNQYLIPITFVEEDAIDVRVSDLPPETPKNAIAEKMRQYGEVLTITDEVWRSFFPGICSGVRVVRMKISSSIPSYISIGHTTAHITHRGQVQTCKFCNLRVHKNQTCTEAKATRKQQASGEKQKPRKESNKEEHEEAASLLLASTTAAVAETKPMEQDSNDDDDDFTLVTKKNKRQHSPPEEKCEKTVKKFISKKGDHEKKGDQEKTSEEQKSEIPDEVLKTMSGTMAVELLSSFDLKRWSKVRFSKEGK